MTTSSVDRGVQVHARRRRASCRPAARALRRTASRRICSGQRDGHAQRSFLLAAVLAGAAILALLLHRVLRSRRGAPAAACASPPTLVLRSRRRTWMRIGVPTKPNCSRSWLIEEPLVREMERRRDVGEEHERRRRDADLRRVHDPHVLAARADRRVRRGDRLDELVQRRRRHALAAAPRRPCRSSRAPSASARRSAPRCGGSARSRETASRAAARRRTSSTKSWSAVFTRSHLFATMTMPRPARSASPPIAAS